MTKSKEMEALCHVCHTHAHIANAFLCFAVWFWLLLLGRCLCSVVQSISSSSAGYSFFYGIFSLLKAPAESGESVPNEGDEGQATEDQFLGEVSVAL